MRISVVAGDIQALAPSVAARRYLCEAAAGLAALGHDVELATDRDTDDGAIPGVSMWHPPAGAWGGPSEALVRHLRADRPHLVLWETSALSALHDRPRVLLGTRHIAVFLGQACDEVLQTRLDKAIYLARSIAAHGSGPLDPQRRLARFLDHSFDGVVVAGRSAGIALLDAGLSADRVRFVPPGRERDITPRSDPYSAVADEVTFLVTDDPGHDLDPDEVVRTFGEARQAAPHARLRIVHTDPLEARAAHLAGLATAEVMILGPGATSPEAWSWMLDAAGAGLALVAPDIASVRDVAAPGSLLYAPGSSDGLRAAIVRFAMDQVERATAATLARDWFEAWPTWPETTELLADAIGVAQPGATTTDWEPATDESQVEWAMPDVHGTAA